MSRARLAARLAKVQRRARTLPAERDTLHLPRPLSEYVAAARRAVALAVVAAAGLTAHAVADALAGALDDAVSIATIASVKADQIGAAWPDLAPTTDELTLAAAHCAVSLATARAALRASGLLDGAAPAPCTALAVTRWVARTAENAGLPLDALPTLAQLAALAASRSAPA